MGQEKIWRACIKGTFNDRKILKKFGERKGRTNSFRE